MTEAEWLGCTDPAKMLDFLQRRASKRKRRLFSVACCRRIWPLIVDDRSRSAVLVAERFADDQATGEELQAAESEAKAIWLKDPLNDPAMACHHVCTKDVAGIHAAGTAIRAVWSDKLGEARRQGNPVPDGMAFCEPIRAAEEAEQCRLIRDIFGNPFRPLPPRKGKRAWEDQKRRWLTWQDGTVPKIAWAIYDGRAFDRLPILADALEEAGCQDADILGHCRQQGAVHLRGCWVLDLLTGRS